MSIDPLRLFKCLAEETRLMMTLLISREQELCVCEMTHALEQSQPKVSRHLAELRRCGLLADRRDAQWVYYRLEPGLPAWALAVLEAAAEGRATELERVGARLAKMGNRPERRAALC
ncbi:metalloregulator ArsR/SmtB family transcription factor [Halomonas sp. YLGW01]|uniref:metalloregulator ArsR/SmtB family transcription factor n=1 Tax=Halomonas sp. YLGW01 TaxID=2773308 RepID=UPI0024133603|nr:metalloregulator ArsR/SmtB family transcription factor [Halomonas sp. YLGW01]